MAKYLIMVVVAIVVLASVGNATWFNESYNNRININISTDFINQTHTQVPIILNSTNWGSDVCLNTACNDSIVTWLNPATSLQELIHFYYERYNTTGNTALWINATLNDTINSYYVYFNGSTVQKSIWNNGTGVFFKFYDFENMTDGDTAPLDFGDLAGGDASINASASWKGVNSISRGGAGPQIVFGLGQITTNMSVEYWAMCTASGADSVGYFGGGINGSWSDTRTYTSAFTFGNTGWEKVRWELNGSSVTGNITVDGTTRTTDTGTPGDVGQVSFPYSTQAGVCYIDEVYFGNYLPQDSLTFVFGTNEEQPPGEYVLGYNSIAYELTEENFNITFLNLSYFNYSNVNFTYNNTYYNTTQLNTSTWAINITTPFIPSNDTLIYWHWNWTRNDSTSNTTTVRNHSIAYSFVLNSATFNVSSANEGQIIAAYLQVKNYTSLATITSMYFVENVTNHLATTMPYNGTLNYNRTITLDYNAADSETRDYNWTMNVYYSNQVRQQNMSTGTLTIYKLIVTECYDGNLTGLIYRTYDEITWAYLNNSNYKLEINLMEAGVTRSYSSELQNAWNASICVYPTHASYEADITMYYNNNYSTVVYPQRQWNHRLIINNETKNFGVYLLNSSEVLATSITTLDIDNLPEPNTVVLFQKFNYTENAFINMTSTKTNADGEAFTYLNQYDTPYTIVLMDTSGNILSTYDDYFVVSNEIDLRTTTTFDNYYDIMTGVVASCSYDNNTKILTCEYDDPSESLTQVLFEVTESGLWGAPVICNETQNNTYSGIFTCDISLVDAATKGFVYRLTGKVVHSPERAVVMVWGVIDKPLPAIYGASGVALSLLIFCGLFFMGIGKPTVAIAMGLFGFFACVWLGLLDMGTAFEYGVGLAVVVFILAIWRLKG